MTPPDFAKRLTDSLKAVHNYGARLYNDGCHSEALHIYQGALMLALPLLNQRPEMVTVVAEGLQEVESTRASIQVKAFRLHEVLDHLRDMLKAIHGTSDNLAKTGEV